MRLAFLEVRGVASPEEHRFVIPLDTQSTRLPQNLHGLLTKAILTDRIPGTQQHIGGGHVLKRAAERLGIGMDVGDDTNLHFLSCFLSLPSSSGRRSDLERRAPSCFVVTSLTASKR